MALSKVQKIAAGCLGTGIVCPSSYGIYALSTSPYRKNSRALESVAVDGSKYGDDTFLGGWLKKRDLELDKDGENLHVGIVFLDPSKENEDLWDSLWKNIKEGLYTGKEGDEISKIIDSIKTSFNESNSTDSLNGRCQEWYLSGDDYQQKESRNLLIYSFCSLTPWNMDRENLGLPDYFGENS